MAPLESMPLNYRSHGGPANGTIFEAVERLYGGDFLDGLDV